MTVYELWFVDRLGLIESVSILSSQDVSVLIVLCFPGGFVKQLCIILETRCFSADSFTVFHLLVKFNIVSSTFLIDIGLGAIQWLKISLSKSGTPLFIEAWMWLKEGFFAVTSEECRSSFIKGFLVVMETLCLPFIHSVIEVLLFSETSFADLGVNSSKL
jgi:hypothetical protein